MAAWTCPECKRRFGTTNRSHECAPALSVDDYFATGPAHERPIFEAVRDHLESIADDDLVIEPVSVGIFFKRKQTFLELRPKRAWVAVSFRLLRAVEHPRIARVIRSGARTYHIVNVRSPDEIDDDLRSWLTESYDSSID